jgi:hypothetical protein
LSVAARGRERRARKPRRAIYTRFRFSGAFPTSRGRGRSFPVFPPRTRFSGGPPRLFSFSFFRRRRRGFAGLSPCPAIVRRFRGPRSKSRLLPPPRLSRNRAFFRHARLLGKIGLMISLVIYLTLFKIRKRAFFLPFRIPTARFRAIPK